MLVQDFLAQKGFTVLSIDYFMGDPVHLHTEAGFDPMKWVDQIRKVADEVTPRWLAGVKEKYGKEPKYCVAGYCFGAPYTMELATDEDVVAVSLAHPGLLDEDHFRRIKKPLMLSLAENDFAFPLKQRRIAEDILVENKAQYYIQIFSGVQHGFAARGDPSSADIRWGKEQSAEGVAMWFHRFLDEKAVARDASSGMI
ncbi:alpha/beta-hydrolase [Gymnopus androsaceus JB14]|uniref:Alpha/beta-hydrolase n=1 Tax=Gymnopus androsaceus JB14 TaxID=1447944 RepID=A0A6A4GUZ0_9AGAR|nr:alpha/beta-hydrolase [Gymnopus androsaceus JB14]